MTSLMADLCFRYIAVCFPIVHRDLVHTYSVAKRVMAYTGPVLILSLLINIPKFFETKVTEDQTHHLTHPNGTTQSLKMSEADLSNLSSNVSVKTDIVYSIAVTELRYVRWRHVYFKRSFTLIQWGCNPFEGRQISKKVTKLNFEKTLWLIWKNCQKYSL